MILPTFVSTFFGLFCPLIIILISIITTSQLLANVSQRRRHVCYIHHYYYIRHCYHLLSPFLLQLSLLILLLVHYLHCGNYHYIITISTILRRDTKKENTLKKKIIEG